MHLKNCQLYTYDNDEVKFEEFQETEVLNYFNTSGKTKGKFYWLNYHSLRDQDAISELFEEHHFHRLTLEDVFTEKHRPKLEEFDSYIFFSIQSVLPTNGESSNMFQEQISFILGKNYVISLQEKRSDHFPEIRDRLNAGIGLIRKKGPDFLLFKLLDAIVDNYFEVLDHNAKVIQDLEFKVMRDTSEETLLRVEDLKRSLIQLRGIVVPLKDITMQLEKSTNRFISADNAHYFSDLKDNCLSALDEIDANKNILESLSNLYYAAQGQKMNEIMKVLTIVSTIFIPLTFIAGVYGMNFKNMPELQMEYGYYIVWGVMIVIAVLLWFYFRSKGWIKNK